MEKVKVTAQGWLLFCPIYLQEGWECDYALAPIPKWNAWILLDAALGIQQGINWLVSLFNPEACGFWAWIKPIAPKEITVQI